MSNATLPGTYVLIMALAAPRRVAVGRLGEIGLAPGAYLYVGSALGGLEPRLRRHLRLEKRLHWHIDYLRAAVEVVAVWYRPGRERLECAWAAVLAELPGVKRYAPGFGASDCRCPGHLLYAAVPPTPAAFAARVGPIAVAPLPPPQNGQAAPPLDWGDDGARDAIAGGPWLDWDRDRSG